MAEDQKDRYIQYLAEQNQEPILTEKAMKLVLEDFMAKQKVLEDQLCEECKLRKSAERKVKMLQEQLDYAKQERFGDRRQRVGKNARSGESQRRESDRKDEKDD